MSLEKDLLLLKVKINYLIQKSLFLILKKFWKK